MQLSSSADEATLLHELGHVLAGPAAGHLEPGEVGVMARGRYLGAWRPCITPADIDLVCSAVTCARRVAECKP